MLRGKGGAEHREVLPYPYSIPDPTLHKLILVKNGPPPFHMIGVHPFIAIIKCNSMALSGNVKTLLDCLKSWIFQHFCLLILESNLRIAELEGFNGS